MKQKYFFWLLVSICLYGFLPISFWFNKNDLKIPNNLLVEHLECGCPCPDVSVKAGKIIIPNDIKKKYPNVSDVQINLKGTNPFKPYQPEFTDKGIMIKGKIVGTAPDLCDENSCEVILVFEVESWSVNTYYPTIARYENEKIVLIIWCISTLLTGIICLKFIKDLFFKLCNTSS